MLLTALRKVLRLNSAHINCNLTDKTPLYYDNELSEYFNFKI